MTQVSYSQEFTLAQAGLLADTMFNDKVSMRAEEVILFGLGLIKSVGEDGVVRLPIRNVCTILDDAGTYSSGTFVTTINGTPISVVYNGTADQTLTDVATAIAALAFILTATRSNSDNTIIVVAEENIDLIIGTITGLVGGMTITSQLYTVTDTLLGISVKTGDIEQGNRLFDINDQSVITFSGDVLNTSDTVTVTVNGVGLAAVTYATSEAVTLQLIADLIKEVNGVASVSVSGRVITVLNRPGLPLVVNSVVIVDDSGGTAASSIAASQQAVTFNIGDVFYAPSEMVTSLRKGRIHVQVEVAVDSDDDVYVRHVASGVLVRGGFGNVADTSTAFIISGARYVTSAAAGGFAIVEINLP